MLLPDEPFFQASGTIATVQLVFVMLSISSGKRIAAALAIAAAIAMSLMIRKLVL